MEFLEIFTQMHWVAAMFLIIGVVLIIVEVFVPGFGFWGISGAVSLVVGVIVRICMGLNLVQSLTLILLVAGFSIVVVGLIVYSARYGILGKTGLFERGTTISEDYNKTPKELKKLVGRSGKAITNLDMAGKAKIRGKIYDVVSLTSYIEKGSNIKVVGIKDNTILVRKWFE